MSFFKVFINVTLILLLYQKLRNSDVCCPRKTCKNKHPNHVCTVVYLLFIILFRWHYVYITWLHHKSNVDVNNIFCKYMNHIMSCWLYMIHVTCTRIFIAFFLFLSDNLFSPRTYKESHINIRLCFHFQVYTSGQNKGCTFIFKILI